ncbi:MAG TPA: succinate dehydrogenase assembly factor 2 [Candidatus Methylomirabilis sp.]|nr:succinate dehydrogenase assembly factor 2 [Candidatus Methylomirabilis sp.]
MEESTSPSSPFLSPQGKKGATGNTQGARHVDRLRWRCRRGVLELDLVLLAFLERRYPDLSSGEKMAFDKLLEIPDELLLAYVRGNQTPPENELKRIVTEIRK